MAEWWLEHIIVFRDFVNAENQRTKGEVEYIVKLLDRLKKARRSLSIRMAFQSDHLQALAQLIKEAEQGNYPNDDTNGTMCPRLWGCRLN